MKKRATIVIEYNDNDPVDSDQIGLENDLLDRMELIYKWGNPETISAKVEAIKTPAEEMAESIVRSYCSPIPGTDVKDYNLYTIALRCIEGRLNSDVPRSS